MGPAYVFTSHTGCGIVCTLQLVLSTIWVVGFEIHGYQMRAQNKSLVLAADSSPKPEFKICTNEPIHGFVDFESPSISILVYGDQFPFLSITMTCHVPPLTDMRWAVLLFVLVCYMEKSINIWLKVFPDVGRWPFSNSNIHQKSLH